MNEIHDDFILSNNASSTEIMDSFERVGLVLKGRPLKFKTVVALGRLLDFLKKWILRKAEFPLSEATAYLMFANMAYSSAKAQKQLGFKPRPVRDTFSDHFQDLIHRGVIEVDCAGAASVHLVARWMEERQLALRQTIEARALKRRLTIQRTAIQKTWHPGTWRHFVASRAPPSATPVRFAFCVDTTKSATVRMRQGAANSRSGGAR